MTSARTRRCSATLSIAIAVALVGLSAPAPAAEFTNTACGYRVTYPDGWNIAKGKAASCSFDVANFSWEKIHGGLSILPGGARIDIEIFPPYGAMIRQGDDDDTILTRMVSPSTTVIARTSTASGKPARMTKVIGYAHRLVTTIVHKGGKNFLITLTCGPDDPNCPGYEHVLDDVIASLTVIGSTPVPGSPTP